MNDQEKLQSPEVKIPLYRLEEIAEGVRLLEPSDILAAAEKQREAVNDYLVGREVKELTDDQREQAVTASMAEKAVENEANSVDYARQKVSESLSDNADKARELMKDFGNAN